MNKLTQIISDSSQANKAAIRWLLGVCNGIYENDNGPVKMATWALADVLHKRWDPQLSNAYITAPPIFTEALKIDQARQSNDPRGVYAVRVRVAPEQKIASFVKVPSSPYLVLLYPEEDGKKFACVDIGLLSWDGINGRVRVAGPGEKLFELDRNQTDHEDFFMKCLDFYS